MNKKYKNNTKMKALHKILALLFLIGATGCNDAFMEKYPLDKINDQNYWKTVDDLKTYANQFYPSQMGNLNGYSSDNKSDNQAHRDKDGFIWNETTVPVSGGGWAKNNWSLIRSQNYFLQRYHTVEGDPNTINIYVGEVLFFKAFEYYWKVTTFGDVPWLTKDLTTSSEELYAPRDSRVVVMDSIVACLDKAAAYLPETSADGRLTKYAALTLKSRVCLFEGTYRKYHNLGNYEHMLQQAANAAKQIIDSGLFDLYSTGNPEEDYHTFFQLHDMTGVKEAIFSVQYETDKR